MAVIVGDKLKLSNYSYLLDRDGQGFIGELQTSERRDRQEKLIDAVDIDWRPFRFKNFAYTTDSSGVAYNTPIENVTFTYATEAGDLFDTERLIDWISYSYSMGKNLDFNGYIFHNSQVDIKRPTMLTNIGWVDKDSRIIGYTYWPVVGSVYNINSLSKDDCDSIFSSTAGEIFNDYENNEASGMHSHAEGMRTHATILGAHAEGAGNTASGISSHAEGINNRAIGIYSHVEGSSNVTYHPSTHAEGADNITYGNCSHVEGSGNTTHGKSSHAEGMHNTTYGFYSHAEGELNIASSYSSHAEGKSTQSVGSYSHSEGLSTIALGKSSHAEGSSSQAIGMSSHAEGQNTTAYGPASHAEGFSTYAGGDYSHVEGNENSAYGNNSHVEGKTNTLFSGNITHIEGSLNSTYNSSIIHVEGSANMVNDATLSHIGGYSSYIYAAYSSFIHGSSNTVSNVSNALILGSHDKIENGNFSTIIGHNSYTYSSYNIIISNDSYSSSTITSYNVLIGNKVTSSKTHNILIGEDITAAFGGGEGNVSFGRNNLIGWNNGAATSSHFNISVGVDNITTNKRPRNVLIGYALNIGDNSDSQTLLGRYNETLGVGYQFALGDGSDNEHRHNAIVTTNTNWTYITALASYINNITTTEQNVKITYNTNFVTVKSFNNIARDNTNTYNLNFNTYLLPTKRYVDKLLAAKDVFRFAGTFTPQITSWEPKQTSSTVAGTWTPSHTKVGDVDNDTNYSYSYSNVDFSAGAVWKSTTTGWFGSTYVMGGDIIISYSDAANGTNESGWAVIDTHIAFMENWGTYSTYKGNGALLNDSDKDLRNFFITNINLSDTGYLSYAYAGILTEYRTDTKSTNSNNLITKSGAHNNKKFLSNISLIRHDDRIELAYTYTDFLSCYVTPSEAQYTDVDTMTNDNLTFVYNVHLDNDGVLSYSKYTMRGFRHHHHLTGAYNWTYAYLTYSTGDDLTYIVSNIHLTYDGHLSYAYTVLSNLRNHHRTRTYDFGEFNIDTEENEALRVVTNVNLDGKGNLSYTGYSVTNLLNHHHTKDVIHTTSTTGRSSYYKENDIDVNSSTYTVDSSDNPTNSNRTIQFLTYAYLSSDGDLQTYYANITNIRRHHKTCYSNSFTAPSHVFTTHQSKVGNGNGDNGALSYTERDWVYVLDNVNLSEYGYLTYSYTYISRLRNHHDLGEVTKGTDLTTASTDSIIFLDGVNLDNKGTLTYHHTKINNLLSHHVNESKGLKTAYDVFTSKTAGDNGFGFISNVNLDKNGKLTYDIGSVTDLRQHHFTTVYTLTAYNVDSIVDYTGKSNPTGDSIRVIDNVNLDNKGTLTYSGYVLTNLKNHHHTLSEIHTTSTVGRKNNSNEQDYDVNSGTLAKDSHKVISYVWQNSEGKLQAYYYTLNNLAFHHSNDDKGTTSLTTYSWNNTYTDVASNLNSVSNSIKFVDNVNLTTDGKFTYHLTTISNLRHHHSYKDTTVKGQSTGNTTTYNVGEFNETGSDSFGFISNVSMTTDGRLTYTTSSITNLKTHHGTTKPTEFKATYHVNLSKTTWNDAIGFISEVNLDADGEFTYKVSRIDGLRKHHSDSLEAHSSNFGGNNFVTDISLSEYGDLTGTFGTFGYSGTHNTSGDKNFSAGAEQKINVVTGIKIDGSGQISYSYSEIKNTRNHHSTGVSVEGPELNVISKAWSYTPITYTAGEKAHDNAYTDSILFLDGVKLNSVGTLTYHYTKINHLRSHHRGRFVATVDNNNVDKLGQNGHFAFVDSISLSPEGELTATSKTVEIPKNVDHSDSTGKFDHKLTIKHGKNGTATTILDNWDGSKDVTVDLNNHGTKTVEQKTGTLAFDSTFNVVTGVSLDSTGYLSPIITTYTLPTRNHHSGSVSGNFITSVSLSSSGNLTGNVGTFGANTASTGSTITINEDDNELLKVITGATIDSNGKLTYTVQSIKDHLSHHSQNTVTAGNFVSGVSLSSKGALTRSYGNFANNQNYTGNYSSKVSQKTNGAKSGNVVLLSYSYLDSTGQLKNRYETIQLQNQKIFLSQSSNASANSTTIVKSVSLTLGNEDSNGDKTFTFTEYHDNIWGVVN